MARGSDPGKLAVWREGLERFSSSGLAVGLFCARERVSVASFYNWRKKLSLNGRSRSATEGRWGLGSGPAEGRGRFQQVAVASGAWPVLPAAPATRLLAGMVCVQLPWGTRMEVGAEDLDAFRAVVAEVVGADRAWEAPGRADCGRGAGGASC